MQHPGAELQKWNGSVHRPITHGFAPPTRCVTFMNIISLCHPEHNTGRQICCQCNISKSCYVKPASLIRPQRGLQGLYHRARGSDRLSASWAPGQSRHLSEPQLTALWREQAKYSQSPASSSGHILPAPLEPADGSLQQHVNGPADSLGVEILTPLLMLCNLG